MIGRAPFQFRKRIFACSGFLVGSLRSDRIKCVRHGDYARAKKKLDDAQSKDPASPYIQANQQLLRDSYSSGKSVQ